MLEENSQIEPCRNPITRLIYLNELLILGYWNLVIGIFDF
jgi:hypothetical protein